MKATNTTMPEFTHTPGRPTWEVAALYPEQGGWTEEQYAALNAQRGFEFADGFIERLPMPTNSHQVILFLLARALAAFVEPSNLGSVLPAGIRVRLRPGLLREPDVSFMSAAHADRIGEDYWMGADLVMEVVRGGPEDRKRDLVTKRAEYAATGIPEYWIVDPKTRTITVLKLKGKKYAVHGRFGRGRKATSPLLPGFAVEVGRVFGRKRSPPARESKERIS